jgi:predicted dehydrogenase
MSGSGAATVAAAAVAGAAAAVVLQELWRQNKAGDGIGATHGSDDKVEISAPFSAAAESQMGSHLPRKERLGGFHYAGTPRCYVVGAGSRGGSYARMALEGDDEEKRDLEVVGVAEPNGDRRESFAALHGLDSEYVCEDWTELLALEKRADFVLVTTLDTQHAAPAIAFMKAGFHVLVEKPLATTVEDCTRMVQTAKECGVMLGVCHVLRYTPYTRAIVDLVRSGAIGKVRTVNLVEPVGNWHFAHSYVRGNWRNQQVAAFVLMAKSCHDIDWIRHVVGLPFRTVLCSGAQLEFTREQKPAAAGSALRCSDCAHAPDCPYDASLYTRFGRAMGATEDTPAEMRFPVLAAVGKPEATLTDIEDAVATGNYGRCVYECDNDQPDVVSAIYRLGHPDDQVQVTFEMRALTEDICKREVTICGTDGEIRGDMETVRLTKFKSGGVPEHSVIAPKMLASSDTQLSGHWGADWFLMNAWCAAIDKNDPSFILSGPDESLESHMAVFASETARLEDRTVDIQQFMQEHSTS